MTKMVNDQSDARLVTRSLCRSRAIGLFWLVTIIVLVLSEAVFVIVIDVSMNLRAGLRDTIEFHRHSGQHRDDPNGASLSSRHRLERGFRWSSAARLGWRHTPGGHKARFDYEYEHRRWRD